MSGAAWQARRESGDESTGGSTGCGRFPPRSAGDAQRSNASVTDTRRLRLALAAAFSPRLLRRIYDLPFVDVLPPRFDRILLRRLERGFGRHPNAGNPFASALLLGRTRDTTPAPLTVETADAIDFLEACAPRSFNGITLSNILDGADSEYSARLFDAVRRAAAPGAVMILRSFREPTDDEAARWAARDRALVWGSIRVERL